MSICLAAPLKLVVDFFLKKLIEALEGKFGHRIALSSLMHRVSFFINVRILGDSLDGFLKPPGNRLGLGSHR